MRVGEVIGKLTLSTSHPSLKGASWRVVTPLTLEGINNDPKGRTEPIVVYDEMGAGDGTLIAIAEGPEATAPFHPVQKPIDGYVAALVDRLTVEG